MTQENVLKSLLKRISEMLFDNEEIFPVLVERLRQKSDIVFSFSLYHNHERIKEAK